ncbi:hypothetical protein Q5752_003598 [Cryptotrichosporon argae]
MARIDLNYTTPLAPKGVPDPPGYFAPASAKDLAKAKGQGLSTDVVVTTARKSTELKLKRAWELALSPAKSLPMQAVMLYFSGSGVQIFSLGMIFMLLTGPLSAVFNILNAFEAFRPTPAPRADGTTPAPSYALLIPPMITYVLCQGAVLALGLWKCSTMGILPTGSADWVQFESRNEPPEWSAVRALIFG